MERRSRRITNRASGVAAVLSFVTQPIPGADELLVVGIHYYLVVRLARARGVQLRTLPWRSLQRIVWYGAGARLVANFSLGLVPFVGMFSNAITAAALTEFLARWLDEFIEHPESPPPEVTREGMKELFTNVLKKKGKGNGSAKQGGGDGPAG
ncbi:MAG TPA: hypothetical protein VGG39_24165 [Polyangiaceae bacterium]|jgi:uncharacterized protein (DUF697 family)